MRLVLLLLLAGCAPSDLGFGPRGPLIGEAGRGSFRFGVATAATQIEDQNPSTDWFLFTRPQADGGLGQHDFIGDAAGGYTRALEDVSLIEQLHADAYRFSMEWARIEPTRHQYDEAALAHYGQLLDALVARGIRPMVTVHHFSNPVWVDDPRDPDCAKGPSDTNLCGFGHPTGGPLVAEALGELATLLGERFGDRVDEWGSLNEPVNYLLASYGLGTFPPGKSKLFDFEASFIPVVRGFLSAHAAIYHALKAADVIDADGDGVAAAVGLPLSVIAWAPARANQLSDDPADLAAVERITWVYHHLVPEALRQGRFDANLDGVLDEDQPTWRGTLDWLGVQYYFRTGVTAAEPIIPVLALAPCFSPFDFGACLPPLDASYCVPQMRYEYDPAGLYPILVDLGRRWPDLPLLVTEGGIATDVGARRSANIVRTLEQIARAQREGIDVRGYYHWSLYDNFEWAEGYRPHFGLFSVDRTTLARSPTEAVTAFAEIAEARTLASPARERLGGESPLPAEPSVSTQLSGCTKDALGL